MTVHIVAKSQTGLKQLSMHAQLSTEPTSLLASIITDFVIIKINLKVTVYFLFVLPFSLGKIFFEIHSYCFFYPKFTIMDQNVSPKSIC